MNVQRINVLLAGLLFLVVAFMRRTLYKDGFFNTLCLPFDVPSIAASPLAGAEVYTFESGEVVENDHVIIIRNGERYDVTGKKLDK